MPRKTFTCNGIRAVIVLFISFFFLICEADFLEENYLNFVGSEALGNIDVLTSVTFTRGRLKLRCSSECLKTSTCSGVRIDLNSSGCSLLIGQFNTVENLESHYRFYKVYVTLDNSKSPGPSLNFERSRVQVFKSP